MQKVLRHLLFCVVALYFHFSALADGKVFSQVLAVPTKTPDQRALLHYHNGTERLVIETSFVGEGTNFAWVVPFPSEPKIEAVSVPFFSRLNSIFQPNLIYQKSKLWIFFLTAGCFVVLALILQRESRDRFVFWLILIGVVSCVFLTMVPTFVKARGASTTTSPRPSVEILQRQSVGIYDTVTLRSKDGTALLDWLNDHHFATPTNALPVISKYAQEGWVFAAATLDVTQSTSGGNKPHPLCFTFATEKAVYPLRLTGVENDACSFELFVFGPDRAEANGFKVEYCGHPSFSEDPTEDWISQMADSPSRPGLYRISDPEMLKTVQPSTVTTKLTGTLSPRQMRSDLYLRWVPFQPALPTLYSFGAAIDRAMNWSVSILVVGGLIVWRQKRRLTRKRLQQFIIGMVIISGLAGFLQYQLLPKTEVRTVPNFHAMINNLRTLDGAIDVMQTERGTNFPTTFQEFKRAVDPYVKGGARNPITYEPLAEGKTAGNITLETNGTNIDVIWYGPDLTPHRVTTFPRP